MSEKRFIYHEEYFPLNVREIIDNETGKTYDCEDVTDVLNELFDENEQLKAENEQLHHLKVLANAFIVEKRLEVEFVKWCVEE